jgi:hypothetical protein
LAGAEAQAIRVGIRDDQEVQRFLTMLQVTQMIGLNGPLAQGGVNCLASINLIAVARVALTLAGWAKAA